jgi:crotonobetainyl-CoA:carnitine CoA-transferase CaiB-like acyl-CoA transferase
LFHRERTGEGQNVEVSLLDSVLTWTGYFPYMFWYGDKVPQRVGLHHHTMAPYGPYPCGDDQMVIVAAGAGHTAMFRSFCEAIERPDLLDDPRFATNEQRLQNRAALDERICTATRSQPRSHWLERFHQFGIPAGAMNDLGQALSHPAVVHRGSVKEVNSAVGPLKVFDFPPRSSAYESVNDLGPPLLGEHTATVLQELGFSEREVVDLLSEKIVEMSGRA